MDVNTMNQMFLAASPEIRKRLKKEYDKSHPKVIVMSLKPKYAKAIYEGRKNWEFRKTPPPLFKTIYIYESAPVSKITGTVVFSEEIRGIPMAVYDIVKMNKCFTRNLPGITALELEVYTGPHNLVSALRVLQAERLEHTITFTSKPPQNWGHISRIPEEGRSGDMNDRKFWLVANTIVTAFNLLGAAFALYVWLGGPLAGF